MKAIVSADGLITLEQKIAKEIWSTDEPDFNAEAEAGTPYQNYNGVLADIAKIACEWQRNDPAFIAEIVEKTLGYVANGADYIVDIDDQLIIDRAGIRAMHPDIVNQILKEKV